MKNGLRTIVLIALAAVTARGDDWPHWGRTADRLRSPAETVLSPSLHGSVATGSDTAASPVAADGFLVVAGLDGVLRAYAEDTRAPLWSVPVESPIIGTPLVDQGRVYVSSTDGTLRIHRLSDGAWLSSVETGGADQSSPVLSGGRLYLGSGFPNTALRVVDPATQSIAWSAELSEHTNSSPVVSGGRVVIVTNSGTLWAFDASTGAPVWSTVVGGTPGTAAPLVVGTSVFVPAGATLSRVDLDPSNWGSNGSVVFADPTPPPPTAAYLSHAASSLSVAGGVVTGLVRFDYACDTNSDGYQDTWAFREYAFAVDAGSLALLWQVPLADVTVPDPNAVPPFRLLPAPVSTGPAIAVASSMTASLRLLSPATGAVTSTFALDAPCLASPFVANARLYAMTRTGTLVAYEGTTAPPSRAAGLTPDAVEVAGTPASLSWNSAGSGATYVVRLARDGEVLMNWDFETVVSGTSTAVPAQLDGYFYTWGVRVRSAEQAYAPWSLGGYGQTGPIAPPGPLSATPQLRQVDLAWTASTSPAAAGYRVTYAPTAGGASTSFDLGPVTSTVVAGLTALTSYTFDVRTLDHLGHESAAATATATPLTSVTIAGTPYATIAAALAAANAGDIVDIGPDVVSIAATIQVPANVTLRGAGALDTRLVGAAPIVLLEALQGSTIRGLTLVSGQAGIQVVGTGVVLRNTIIRDMADAGVVVDGSALIVNNTIVGNGVAGVRATGPATARNNIVQQNGVGLSGAVSSTYNLVADGYALCVVGLGDLATPVAFLDPATGDYREQSNQVSLDAGSPTDDYSLEPPLNGGRINMGAFGNTAQAATSLTAGTAPPSPGRRSDSGCGLTGLEVLLLLALRRRRR